MADHHDRDLRAAQPGIDETRSAIVIDGDTFRTRREMREARSGRSRNDVARAVGGSPKSSARRRGAVRTAASVSVMTLTAGLVATLALPSYAFDPVAGGGSEEQAGAVASGQLQNLSVPGDAVAADLTFDAITSTSEAELRRAELAEAFAAYTGPTADDYVADYAASYPTVAPGAAADLSAIFQTALQYQGVPYVFGGATPAGFDCSGYVQFVYAQYGIDLAHSVRAQAAAGVEISAADARPGDLVIFDDMSHNGFYAGDGMILHAPRPGKDVQVAPLWTDAVHYVRIAG